MKKIFFFLFALFFLNFSAILAQDNTSETLQSLASQFVSPADAYKPQAWWHWLGRNYSKQGMTLDLEAMKTSGVGGVVIFNAPSWIDPLKTPWVENTYRSEAYFDALGHALKEAKRLGLKVGIHNTPGWSHTGGPWVEPEDGMQTVWFSEAKIKGGKDINITLPNPASGKEGEAYYKDEATFAVLSGKDITAGDIIDVSANISKDGRFLWNAPAGDWTIYRIGYYPTFLRSHPTPEDVSETALEADKMNPAATRRHWNNVLNPLKERFPEYIGTTFDNIWLDSYEAGYQLWSPNFRKDFIRLKGYDPARYIALAYSRSDSIINQRRNSLQYPNGISEESTIFTHDWADVVNSLFLESYATGKKMVNEAGFQFVWEPYSSIGAVPFDTEQGVALTDLPATEFWVHSNNPTAGDEMIDAVSKYGKRIYGAEAFTGMEATCRFTETPAMLKRPADMGFSYGINRYYLHSWAHNPLDDKYQPGWGFAHYGTHFSRNQTWSVEAKAFFTYLSRCQMLLQQGTFVSRSDSLVHRRIPEADIFFVRNAGETRVISYQLPIPVSQPEIWDAYTGTINAYSGTVRQNLEGKTLIDVKVEKNASLFLIFPHSYMKYAKIKDHRVIEEKSTEVDNDWNVIFIPKTKEEPFKRQFSTLIDFSQQEDMDVKYFSGTAIYEKTIKINKAELDATHRVMLDLGVVYDMASLEINGQDAAVLWFPPFKADITGYLKAGNNTVKIKVTNTWVNRLIGDEQYPEDFEWTDKNQGLRAMTALPDWVLRDEPRPVTERKTFTPWYYFNRGSKLMPAGLIGPVKIVKQTVIIL
ncbi:MAG: hypothetical protein LBJ17_01735 [Dysgonamonadaceae bacterium]|jgi:hypothetical protein|nr:hypothetical protein [Dysgonamonadaceae bacterium]